MYRFGGFVLDATGRELYDTGRAVHLEPQAFDVLCYLIEHRARVVDKSELLDRVWGHNFLSEANLTTRIKEIRRALGDDGRQQHTIRNVRGRGYRFVANLRDDATPLARPRLFGRDVELRAIGDLLRRSRVVTLTGPGGVGKSSLATAAAAEVDSAFVYRVELSTLAAGEHVMPAVARTVDVMVDHDRPDIAVRSIAGLDAVLLLDNCEHVLDAVTSLVDHMLSVAVTRVRVLATSQIRLGLSEEVVVPIAPLAAGQAVELFTARAGAVDASWEPAAVGADRIGGLISSLDRLPLAIEMAAGRLASMTFDDLERAIAEKLPLLQMSHRAPAPRHRSLESLVRWSAELLEPAQWRAFTRFSVFAGGVSEPDAAAVLTPDEHVSVAADLAVLAERSLLVADRSAPQTRYAMLTTVRTVAEHWLEESGEAEPVRARHAEHVAEVLEMVDDQLRTHEEIDGRRRLDAIVAEVRAAHQWARRNAPELASRMSGALFNATYSSLWYEPAEWSRSLVAGHPPSGDVAHPGAALLVAGAAANRGDLTFARERAKAVAESASGRLRAIAVEVLADVALYEGDLDAATRAATELGRLGQQLGDAHATTIGSVDLALARVYGGDARLALDDLEQIAAGDLAPTDRAWLAYARGDALSALQDERAVDAYLDAIDLGTTVGSRLVISVSRTALATAYACAGELGSSLDAFRDALQDYVRHGNHTHAVTALRSLVGLLALLRDDEGAAIIAGAVSSERLRVSYGTEAEQISAVLDSVQGRAGATRFDAWFSAGRRLDLDRAVRLAAELLERHRQRSSDIPHTTHQHATPARDSLRS